jgi:hypothetical protein
MTTRVFQYHPETKHESLYWKSSRKNWISESRLNTSVICFSDKEITHYESIPPKQTLDQAFYLQILEHLYLFIDS